jgi:hypothetical protein
MADIDMVFGLQDFEDQVKFQSINFSLSYCPWTLKNIMNYQFSALFFSLLTDIYLRYQVTDQVVALGLRKLHVLPIVSFLHFCSPPYWLCSLG